MRSGLHLENKLKHLRQEHPNAGYHALTALLGTGEAGY